MKQVFTFFKHFLWLLFFASQILNAQAVKYGKVSGIITDENNKPLMGVNVIILGTSYGAATNHLGKYLIKNVPVGEYKIKASFVGFEPKVKKVKVYAGKKVEIDFKLKEKSFNIGGITVTAESDLIPQDVETKTEISAAEIEHYQATNIGDVLDLVPGVQKSDNPGLDKTGQVAVRGDDADALSAFGTKVIIDGVPQSNNANLQFEELTGADFGVGTLGRGVDLRAIPADNVESITVVSGLPSVRYGDFTNGIIELKTKIGAKPTRLKIKQNPSTTEGNLGGGFNLWGDKNALSYNINVAQSQRDLRVVGDEYTRYTGQLVYSTLLFNDAWQANYKISGQGINDEEEPKGDLLRTKNYNRGFTLGFNTWGKYTFDYGTSVIDYAAYVNYKKIDTHKSRLQTEYVITPEGDTVASYIGELDNKGVQWTTGGNFNYSNVFFTGDYIHKILVGTDLQYDVNTGDGIIIDTVFNYYGYTSKRRSYSYDDIPGMTQLSVYAEDKITGHLGVDFSFLLGFRYDMYNPQSFNFSGLWGDGDLVDSRQGSYFNPRMSMILYFSHKDQLRFSVGKTSKSPPLSTLYPPEEVMQWRNPETGEIEYFRYNRWVPDLKGIQSFQAEISYDRKFWNKVGTTISAYYRERTNQPSSVTHPVFTMIDSVVYYVDSYTTSANIGKTFTRGVEFRIRTAKIKPLNINFTIVGSYNFNDYPGAGKTYSLYPDTSLGQYPNYHVPGVPVDTVIGWMYPRQGQWSDKFQINYYLKYTNKELGLWITLRAEQVVKERRQYYDLVPVDYDKLTEEQLLNREYDEAIFTKPNKWLFNFSISKSLFPGAEVSFYVNNFLDDPGYYTYYDPTIQREISISRNPDIYYGIEFSMIFDKFWR